MSSGYDTRSASVLTQAEPPDERLRKLPHHPQLPFTLLARLAVDQPTKGQGLGEYLLLDALHRSLAHADQIAAMAVVADAEDESAAAVYRHFDFLNVQARPSRWFLPMRLVDRSWHSP